MNDISYLYGASIQGIQNYIFQTNKLREIVARSAKVNAICTEEFDHFQGAGQLLVGAAGNIKCLFTSKEECEEAVLRFPKHVQELAPGITIGEAVVKVEGGQVTPAHTEELERRLRVQRNRPVKSLTTGLMATERDRATGLPIALEGGGTPLGNATKALYEKFFGRRVDFNEIGYDTEDLTGHNDWLAIIHADGNSLGEVVAQLGSDGAGKLREFSQNLDRATIAAARKACEQTIAHPKQIRPVVIGGDDLTVICQGSLAVAFTSAYLEAFEAETRQMGHPLTACAGVAFIKSSYPFHYGYDLAETLCGLAKKDAKGDAMKARNGGRIASCLMFHKVQSSFVEDFAEIERKELTPSTGSYLHGPYYTTPQEGRWTIRQLLETADAIATEGDDEANAAKTDIRQWLSLMGRSAEAAAQKSNRVRVIGSQHLKSLYETATKGTLRDDLTRYPAYDILALQTVVSQTTK